MTVFCKWGSYAVPEKLEVDRADHAVRSMYQRGIINDVRGLSEAKAIIRAALDEEVKAGGPYYLSTGEK